ncbi:MAG TPA: SDR family oxidoreductase [Candidatus Dormibacteraeota bacterium]|nr:SDR family oxidoreductase [Candidatus Dormibacteraeota bacterium]
MDLGLSGRLALVTGASAGIGEACALALAAEGARVAVAARRRDRLDAVALRARELGAPDARAFAVDLRDAASIAALHDAVRRELGDPDVLVVNGGGPPLGGYLDVAMRDWDEAYHLTLRSALLLIDGALPAMRRRRWGRIVALESTSVERPIPGLVLSNALRSAVVGALTTLASEVAGDGVTVNVIATGRIATDRLRSRYPDPAAFELAAREVPARRFGAPSELAPMVAFLCGEPAGYVTGATIPVDGGLLAGAT